MPDKLHRLTDQFMGPILGGMTKPATIVADATAMAFVLASWAQALPLVAAGFAALWYLVQIWESKTVRAACARVARWFTKGDDDDLFI